jgi:alpha-beta hydrolase superfamily lysophospholipase
VLVLPDARGVELFVRHWGVPKPRAAVVMAHGYTG